MQRALQGPERIGVEVLADEAEVVEVEAEMEHRHPDDRDGAQRVEAVEAFLSGSGGGHPATIAHAAAVLVPAAITSEVMERARAARLSFGTMQTAPAPPQCRRR